MSEVSNTNLSSNESVDQKNQQASNAVVVVVCRLCDEEIEASYLEAHTKQCAIIQESIQKYKIAEVRLGKLYKIINKTRHQLMTKNTLSKEDVSLINSAKFIEGIAGKIYKGNAGDDGSTNSGLEKMEKSLRLLDRNFKNKAGVTSSQRRNSSSQTRRGFIQTFYLRVSHVIETMKEAIEVYQEEVGKNSQMVFLGGGQFSPPSSSSPLVSAQP